MTRQSLRTNIFIDVLIACFIQIMTHFWSTKQAIGHIGATNGQCQVCVITGILTSFHLHFVDCLLLCLWI